MSVIYKIHTRTQVKETISGTNRFFRQIAENMGITASLINATDPEEVRKAMKPETKVLLFIVVAFLKNATVEYSSWYVCVSVCLHNNYKVIDLRT